MKTLKEKAMAVLIGTYRGAHHIPGEVHDKGRMIQVSVWDGLSTFDFDLLTRLVILAHDECVRLDISQSSPKRLKLLFHDRERSGDLTRRHPTIEEAVQTMRDAGYEVAK